MTSVKKTAPSGKHPGSVHEVFWAFLGLGVTSFGGPVAHLGYFREAFVVRRRWLDDRAYADLVALCQFLPGPASSQVGMAIGLQRAGLLGLVAAWAAFTLPSAIVLLAFGLSLTAFGDVSEAGWIRGLTAAAVAVVAHAVLGMAKTLTPDAKRATIAVVAMIATLAIPHVLTQIAVIVVSGVLGLFFLRTKPPAAPEPHSDPSAPFTVRLPRWCAVVSLAVFAALLAALPVLAQLTENGVVQRIDAFFRAGALVFGGGHVVLPLLETEMVQTGLVSESTFLAGYGAAQAVPGPLFTFAAYLGGVASSPPTGVIGGAIALIAVFLPAALLVIGVLPFWETFRHAPRAQQVLAGINAGVVGLLAAALYTPVFTAGITGIPTLAIAAAAFVALSKWKAPAWAVVLGAGLIGWLLL